MSNNNQDLIKLAYATNEFAIKFSKKIESLQHIFANASSFLRQIDYEKLAVKIGNIQNRLREMPDLVRQAQDKLLSLGWYVTDDFDIIDIVKINKMSDEEIEQYMIETSRVLKETILNNTKELFPHRYKIIKEAFELHDIDKYNLSIPVMLAQADGISNELLDVSFYGRNRKGEPKTKQAVAEKLNLDNDSDKLGNQFFLRPLDIMTSIFITTWERDEKVKEQSNFPRFNRHGVMHGIDLDYGIEANGLRCIVLLGYLLDLKSHYFNDNDEEQFG